MIANKCQMMSVEMSLDSGLIWPSDQSFFANDWSTTQSFIAPQSPQEQVNAPDSQWLQDFEVFKGLCDDIDLGLNYEPDNTFEAMTKEVDSECVTKVNEYIDYLDSTAFLSPESLNPLSPEVTLASDDFVDQLDLAAQDLNSTSAMTILEEILSSANSTDSEECFDSELDLQLITEVSKDPQNYDNIYVETSVSKRRQTKRKAVESIEKVEKAITNNKRKKTTVIEKKERKRSQNKTAANRYRIKKRAELESIEELEQRYAKSNVDLMAQLQKLQMEFKVVLPLAKAAFASDNNKALQLQMLDIRVLNDNLLD
ncbi:uncharacterized protein LOC128958503 [Oppia nitens]|uniref:uncharacterized protein LOC128958503 n=1 Tax=Oppia nitens TaxID=1686743 RepID=UPI0023DBA60A|nr:uncharacterized protein LOC128958503 [Oppia nitens]